MTTVLSRLERERIRETRAWRRTVTFLALTVMCFGTYLCLFAASSHQVTLVVNDKERVCSTNFEGKYECKYLIYTSAGVFENTDSVLALKNNSGDLYNQLKRQHRYEVDVVGWRNHFFSWYPNITSVEEAS